MWPADEISRPALWRPAGPRREHYCRAMAISTDDLNEALSSAAIACAARAQNAAESGGQGTSAETWASAAAQLAAVVKGLPGSLPARPGIG